MEEEDVCRMIRECLDLRKKYVYREVVSPWKMKSVENSTLSKNSDPFHFEPVEVTAVSLLSFIMELYQIRYASSGIRMVF